MSFISIVIPVFNEKNNVIALAKRLSKSLADFRHELIFVDDRSSDGTWEVLQAIRKNFPNDQVQVLPKKGKQGKGASLLEGIIESRGDVVGIIDADLQYPPEVIPQMISQLKNVDIVIGNRQKENIGALRRMLSQMFNFLFGRMLLGLPYD